MPCGGDPLRLGQIDEVSTTAHIMAQVDSLDVIGSKLVNRLVVRICSVDPAITQGHLAFEDREVKLLACRQLMRGEAGGERLAVGSALCTWHT